MNADATVFVIDDDEGACNSVCALVQSMGVKAESFSSAEEFLASFDETRSGCVVTDLRMLGMSGLGLLEKLTYSGRQLPVIIISAYVDVRKAVRAMRDGAMNVLEKPYEQQELWDTIAMALNRDSAIRLDQAHRKAITDRFEQLTFGERQVLDLITEGKPNKLVARMLGVSVRTVEARRQKIYSKLGVDSLAGLMELVIERKRTVTERQRFSSTQES